MNIENNLINIFRKFPKLYKVIAYTNQYNPGRINPYHNNMHMFEVFEQCVDIVTEWTGTEELKEEELYTAALFHDYDHIGKMGLDDKLNIDRALQGFENYCLSETYTDEFKQTVIDLIKSTQYPSILKDEDFTIEMMFLSDSDMTAQFRNNISISVYNGLKKEFNINDETFFTNQKKFIENLSFKTIYCSERWEYLKPLKIEELENLAICYGVSI